MKKILYTLGFLAASTLCANAQVVTTYAGTGQPGFSQTGADKLNAFLNGPYGIAKDSKGNIFITEEDSHMVSVLSGGKYYLRAGDPTGGFTDGTGTSATRLNSPRGIAIGSDNTIYIVDGGNNAIRKLSPFTSLGSSQTLTTIAGGGTMGQNGESGYAEGVGLNARFNDPKGIAIDPLTGDLIVADYGNQVIRRVSVTTGLTSLVAGFPESNPTSEDGNGSAIDPTGKGAKFAGPAGIWVDANGDIYVSEELSFKIRKISGGIVTTVADMNSKNLNSFGAPNSLVKVGNDWFVTVSCALERISGTNTSIFAGGGDQVCDFLEGTGITARFNEMRNIMQLDANNLLVVDKMNNRIRNVTLTLPTSISEDAVAEKSAFSIYPNPAKNFVTIENKSANAQSTILSVTDIAGREIVRENIFASGATHTLSLDGFRKGIYIIKLQSGAHISTSKLVVSN
jgi:hypothetical protein